MARPQDDTEMVRAWEAATRAQMRCGRVSRHKATAAVTSMVNQATTLAQNAPWLDVPRLRHRAIDEMARYTAFGADVRSRRAQEEWQGLWRARTSPRLHGDTMPSARHEQWMAWATAEERWLAAWQHWADVGT